MAKINGATTRALDGATIQDILQELDCEVLEAQFALDQAVKYLKKARLYLNKLT